MRRRMPIIAKIGVFSISLLATTSAIYLYSPVTKTHADDNYSDVSVQLDVPPRLSMYIDDEDVKKMNASVGTFVHNDAAVYITTNSQYGYSLMFEDDNLDTSMRNRNAKVSDEFSSAFSGSRTSDTMDDNTWGYSLNNTDYNSIPPFGNAIRIRNISTAVKFDGEARTYVDFGIKVGPIVTSGYYADVVIFSAIVNGQDGEPIQDMQEFVCPVLHKDGMYDPTAVPGNYYSDGKTYRLRDARDGRVYTVVSTKDTNCWMAENLDITNYDFDGTSGTYHLPDSLDSWSFSYDSGEVYETNISGHGTYYNYNAASAGTISAGNNSTASSPSICPKNWRMATYDDWGYLFRSYNLSLEDGISKEEAMALPVNLQLSGSYTMNNGLDTSGASGVWWTNKPYSSSADWPYVYESRYTVVLDEDGLRFEAKDRRNGYAIRCVRDGYIPSNIFEYNNSESGVINRE